MNSDLWNVKDLKAPSRNTYKVKNHCVDIHALRNVTADALNYFTNPKLHEEAALLSRCIYRIKQKLRSDKGLKAMEKMNRALLQYLNMKIPQTLETFHNMVPQKYTNEMYLPTLNMLHYLLVRIQGLSKVMLRVIESAQVAAQYLELRVKIAHLWKVAFVCFATVSKLFVLSKDAVKFCCECYSQLQPFLDQLENPGPKWLPDNYVFPADLKSWLDVQWLNEEEIVVGKTEKPGIPNIFMVIDSDSDVEYCNEYHNEKNSDVEEIIGVPETVKPDSLLKIEDLGERVEIVENNSSHKKRKRKRKKQVIKTKKTEETVEDVGDEIENVKTNIPSTPKKRKRSKKNKAKEEIGDGVFKSECPGKPDVNKSNKKLKENQKKTNALENTKLKVAKKTLKRKKINSNLATTEENFVDRISTFEDLKGFTQNFESIYQKHLNNFQKIDRLQFKMLHSSIKKYGLKAKKNKNVSNVNSCIEKVKEMVKARLL